ncbi:MAG: 3-isopropylmalate dehydratase large subunit [Lachnospiraceae bacterium]|nr:3-isopropylmalate dehydratase large subunit [Lachnospiraceae bacterium]
MAKTFAEKALGRAAGYEVQEGDIVTVYPDFCLSHENASSVADTFHSIGQEKVYDPDRIVIVFDHTVPPPTGSYANSHIKTRQFVKEQGIKHFYDMNCHGGICHQILCQEGYSAPGLLIVGSDSHTCTHGAVGAFATGIGRSEMAAVWATGKLWLRVPQSMKITVNGEFKPGVAAKDLILKIAGDISSSGADYLSMEFHGEGISRMSIGERMTLCNMAIEMGAKNAACKPDEKVFAHLKDRAKKKDWEAVWADEGASYVKELVYDLGDLIPATALPGRVDNYAPITKSAGRKIDQAFIGTCTNGRLEDLRAAAEILRGRNVVVRTIVQPASVEIYQKALKEGLIETFIESGCVVNHPGCGPCVGVCGGIIGDGEVCISTANRNFTGRMGSKTSEIILASPATVAASAVNGVVTDPRDFVNGSAGKGEA